MDDDLLIISPPLYMVGKKINCWKCAKRMPVIALLAPCVEGEEHEVCILSNIVALPETVQSYIQKRVPTFQLSHSKTTQSNYYANTCPACGMLSGDIFMQSEPDAPFFPQSEKEASLLFLTEIPIQETVHIEASVSVGTGDLILKYAKRIV